MATFDSCPSLVFRFPVSDQQPLGVVLLVEDQPLVRLVTADLLLEANFRVIEAADAEEALRVLRAEIEVDVLLSDVEMPPGMSGYELAGHVHRDWPWVQILIMSGREWPRENDLPPGAAFLAKPCPNAALLSHVQEAAKRAQAARRVPRPEGGFDAAAEGAAEPLPKTA
jgi:CheY-like chemotaxis protein